MHKSQRGATRLRKVREGIIMEVPTGHGVCVIPAKRANYLSEATLRD
ncbi:MAG: hypothetical protein AAF495_24225 [Pseudomonadota bacterium]